MLLSEAHLTWHVWLLACTHLIGSKLWSHLAHLVGLSHLAADLAHLILLIHWVTWCAHLVVRISTILTTMHLATCHLAAHASSIAHWLHAIRLILWLGRLAIRARRASIRWVSHSWWSSAHALWHSLSHVLAIGLLRHGSTWISITGLAIATILSLHATRIATELSTAHLIVLRLHAGSSKVLTTLTWWTRIGGSCSLIPISL